MTVRILHGDALEQLRTLGDASVHSVVTDPPYLLNFMGKHWDRVDEAVTLDPGLGHWLAGFADGEGCFTARKSNDCYVCEFIIHLRADDSKILKELHQATGIGVIRGPTQRADGGSPMCKWVVSKQADCAKLITIFEAFPLRAKKARDFEIWRRAVQEWIAHEPGDDWAPMADLAVTLSAVKKYGAGFNRDQFFHYQWAREVMRVLKPGGHLLAFGGSRTYHRLAAGIEDAGFEIRDQIQWIFGSGFPKSLDVSKAIDKVRTEDVEPIRVVCRAVRAAMDSRGLKSKQLVEHFGECDPRLIDHWAARDTDSQPNLPTWDQWETLRALFPELAAADGEAWRLNGRKGTPGDTWQAAEIIGEHEGATPGFVGMRFGVVDKTIREPSESARQWQGWGTALKPAHEPIVVARKPLIGTVAANVLKHGTGAINVDACRIPGAKDVPASPCRSDSQIYGSGSSLTTGGTPGFDPNVGRWPANLIHDGSDEVLAGFPDTGISSGGGRANGDKFGGGYAPPQMDTIGFGDVGSAGRFFYQVKPDALEELMDLADHYAEQYTQPATDNARAILESAISQLIAARRIDVGSAGSTVKPADLIHYLMRRAARFFYTSKADADDRNTGSHSAEERNHHPTVKPTDLMQYLVRLVTPPGGTVLDPFAGSGSTGLAADREGFDAILIEREAEYVEIARRRIVGDCPLFAEIAA